MERQQVDISGYSYGQFVTFLFDHAVLVQEGKKRPWYWDVGVGVTFNAANVCQFYTRLFRQPEFSTGEVYQTATRTRFLGHSGTKPRVFCLLDHVE